MKKSIRATLFCIIVLTTGASATLAQKQPASENPRNQAIKKINGFRDDQGDKYDVPNQPPTDSTVYTVEYAAKVQETTPDPQRKQADTPKRRLLTHAAKDRFFAYQTLRYLTGKTDLSYYNTYFTASSGDGSFNLGHTITRKTEALEQVTAVTNLGVKTNLLNGLGNLYRVSLKKGTKIVTTWL